MENNGSKVQPDTGSEHHVPSMALRPQGNRGKRAKAPKPLAAKRPLKLSVDAEIYERLAIHALRRDQTISEVVCDLAVKHLNDWVLHAKPGVPRSEAG